jgi:chaperonin GroES
LDLDVKLKIEDLVKSPNIAEMLEEEALKTIGAAVWDEWTIDKTSRQDWEDKTAEAMKLALQVMEEKTFPWENASNVKFPVVTLAALQYQARAYPSLIPSPDVVKCKVVGPDPDGAKQQRADRIAEFMSFQVLEEDECWEENTDKVLISQAIVGCAFKKSYFDPALKHNVSEHVLAKDLYIPYFAKSLDKASRITQILYVSKNDLVQKNRLGFYTEYDSKSQPSIDTSSPLYEARQEAQGVYAPSNDPSASIELLEQHRYLDLDGDGYEEPYIVTVVKDTQQVLRIVARYFSDDIKRNTKGQIVCIYPQHYFTKFSFIPSPDGGIYDLGFGVLLGPLNQSINTILNQLVDAGTLANTAGGFLGRGVKFRSGDNSFKPFEWKRVDSTGDDLRKGVFPLPVREPSPVLFQLLSLLIDYSERVGMSVDPLVGVNPGQNTPAETSRNMIAEGQRVFNAVFKRTYRGLKEEFRKLYKLNALYMNDQQDYYVGDQWKQAVRKDFEQGEGKDILPAADPNMVTDEQKINQAMMLKSSAMENPGMYNGLEVERKYLKALKIPMAEIQQLLNTQPPPPPPPDPKIIVESMKLEFAKYKLQTDVQLAIMDKQQELAYLQAEITEKEARAMLAMAQAESVESGQQLAALQQAVALMKQKQDGVKQALEVLVKVKELDILKEQNDQARVGRVEAKSDD